MYKGIEIFKRMNELGASKIPFFFLIDFSKQNGIIQTLNELNTEVKFAFQSDLKLPFHQKKINLKKFPISREEYAKKFKIVKKNIFRGNSFLVNLTCETPIQINLSLDEIFTFANAKYKLIWSDKFVCFSPETFIQIKQGRIYSYPMKGTIDASIENAGERILQNTKEMAEHYTIVDLIRNDLSRVAKRVSVGRFRYLDEIKTYQQKLLQVSSEISGELPPNYHEILGDIFEQLLPAGSISGAPKPKTLAIIQEAENYERGFYTGVFGAFDGENLNSAVAIRFIEKKDLGMVFKSGGGITHLSDVNDEYNEMIQKIYVPIH